MPFQMRDAQGNMRTVEDKPSVVLSLFEGMIVWSYCSKEHQIRYGLQIDHFPKDQTIEAAHNLGECIAHYAECESLL